MHRHQSSSRDPIRSRGGLSEGLDTSHPAVPDGDRFEEWLAWNAESDNRKPPLPRRADGSRSIATESLAHGLSAPAPSSTGRALDGASRDNRRASSCTSSAFRRRSWASCFLRSIWPCCRSLCSCLPWPRFWAVTLLQFAGHALEGTDPGEIIYLKRKLGLPYVEFPPRASRLRREIAEGRPVPRDVRSLGKGGALAVPFLWFGGNHAGKHPVEFNHDFGLGQNRKNP